MKRKGIELCLILAINELLNMVYGEWCLTRWGRNKMAPYWQTKFSNAFPRKTIIAYGFKFQFVHNGQNEVTNDSGNGWFSQMRQAFT